MEGVDIQLSFADVDEDGRYREFVEKFELKKTTDDCYTPQAVYNAVADWVETEYGVCRADFARPFWPGADYTRFEYLGKIVVDNPPFSIISKIVKFYVNNGIRFFLFAPALTLFSASVPEEVCAIATGVSIIYENGANVKTSFLTNLDRMKIRTAPELYRVIEEAVNNEKNTVSLPVYEFPDNVITAARIQKYAVRGIEFAIPRGEACFVRKIEAMGGKNLFGGGYLISEKAAAEKAAAEKAAAEKAAAKDKIVYRLSVREQEIINKLSGKRKEGRHDD